MITLWGAAGQRRPSLRRASLSEGAASPDALLRIYLCYFN